MSDKNFSYFEEQEKIQERWFTFPLVQEMERSPDSQRTEEKYHRVVTYRMSESADVWMRIRMRILIFKILRMRMRI